MLISTNTLHQVALQIESAIDVLLLLNTDATAQTLMLADIKTTGLVDTTRTQVQITLFRSPGSSVISAVAVTYKLCREGECKAFFMAVIFAMI
jgi:aspartate/glutamate racemase